MLVFLGWELVCLPRFSVVVLDRLPLLLPSSENSINARVSLFEVRFAGAEAVEEWRDILRHFSSFFCIHWLIRLLLKFIAEY
jgi:hypothetical protein